MAVLGIFAFIASLLLAVPALVQHPWGYVSSLWVGMMILCSMQFAQIGMFRSFRKVFPLSFSPLPKSVVSHSNVAPPCWPSVASNSD